jgi:hypothetical protein
VPHAHKAELRQADAAAGGVIDQVLHEAQ